MKKLSILLLFHLCFSCLLGAQITPPDFLCVKGDTLFWEIPANNCGPFNSYDIYTSQSVGGPYVLLTSITDPTTDFYLHINPSGEQWFYYLESNHDCPGTMPLQSDTLDNRPPEVSPITSASVEGGNVQLNWQFSSSPEVYAYLIYRETPLGVVPIDTVFGENTYLDVTAEPDMQSEAYFVNALDRCGNTSIFDVKHATIFLEGNSDACEQAIVLNWNLYENWPNGIEAHEIWVGVNGTTPVFHESIGPSDTYNFTAVDDGGTYCFVVRAIEAVTGAVAQSNEFCITAEIVQPANRLYLQNVSVLPGNDVEITWGWNTNAEINQVSILRSEQNAAYQNINSETPTFPLAPVNTFPDTGANPSDTRLYYRVETTDDCGKTATSNYGSTILLNAAAGNGNANQVSWTPFDFENAVVSSYELYKIAGGSETNIATLGAGELNFTDAFDPTNLAEAEACYYVVAMATVTTPDGDPVNIQSRSNISCVEQAARIFTPNAFIPDGINSEFKPLVVLGDIERYELSVYDRYGARLFTSLSLDEGWRGKKDGKKYPQGVYMYHIKIVQSSGNIAEKRGPVLLLH